MEGTETGLDLAGFAMKKPLHTRLPVLEAHKMHVESKERDRVAEGRGQYALTVLRERQFNENEEKKRHIRARKHALLVESQRAKFVSSLPQPAQDISLGSVKDKMVDVYDYQYLGISRIPVKMNTVQKYPLFAAADMEVEDARTAAVEHEQEKDVEVDKRMENERKARCRFRQAIDKQKSIKSYGTLMKKLEMHVQKTNRTRAFSRKMPVKDSDADGLRHNDKFEINEKVAEIAVENILQRTKASLANITLRKKVKKAARLSLGKTHAVKTSKGTLTTKQSVSGLRLSVREQSTSIPQQSRVQKSCTSSPGSISSETVNILSTLDLNDNRAGEMARTKMHPEVLTRDCATQTIMTFQGSEINLPSSPSSISFQSLPSNHGIAPMAAQILFGKQTQSTQTVGDIVTTYKKYLLDRNKIAPLTSTSDHGENATVPLKIIKGFEATPIFSMYVKELSKKYFSKETPTESGNGENNAAVRTSPNLFSMQSDSRAVNSKKTNYFQDANGILGGSKTIQKEAKSTFPVKVQRMPQSTPFLRDALVKSCATQGSEKPKSQNTNKNKTSMRQSPKSDVRLDQEPKPVPLIDCTKKQPCIPTGTLVKLSPPIVLTVQSPESTLVVRLAGNKHSKSPTQNDEPRLVDRSSAAPFGELNLQTSPQQQENLARLDQPPFSLQATVGFFGSNVSSPQKDCLTKTSPKWQGETDFFGTLLSNRCKSERQFFRPHPPASLPLGWRQMQSPHELSTICEMDTPQPSFFDGSCLYNKSLLQASKSSSGSENKTTSSIGQVPLWEEILAKICETSTSPFVQREQYSVLDISRTENNGNGHGPSLSYSRFPSQSTPIREDNVPDLESEAGIQDQSMISLIGSEFTSREDEHRVPDTNRSLSSSLVGDSAMCVLSPLKQHMVIQENKPVVSPALQLQSKNTTVNDSLLSFLKHEASCAFSPTPSHCTDVFNFN